MRSGQTRCCVRCRLRFESGRFCPGCGSDGVDLTNALERMEAEKALRHRPWTARLTDPVLRPPVGCVVGLIVSFIVVVTMAAMVGGAFLLGGCGAILGFLLCPIGLTVVWAFVADLVNQMVQARYDARRTVPTPVDVAEPPAPSPTAERRKVSGEVRADGELLRSPLGDVECVAYRVVGTDGPRTVDDAELVPVMWIGDDVRVEASSATLDVPAEDPEPVQPVSEPLRTWLLERLVDPDAESLRLAETVVRAGDPLEAEATPLARVHPTGYRGTTEITLLREAPGSPLVLRRGSSSTG